MQQGSNWKRDGREGGKSHEAEANLPHRETAKRPENSNAGWKKTARFAHGEKPIINHSFSHDLSGWNFKKRGFVFEGRMTDSLMMKCGFSILFVAAIVLFGVYRLVVTGPERVFRIPAPTWKHCHAGTGFFRRLAGGCVSPPDWEKRFPFAYFRLRDAKNMRMNPALSVCLAIPGDPAWDNAATQNLFSGRNRKRLHFRGIAKGQSSGKSCCGLFIRLAFCRQCEWCTTPRFQPTVSPSRHSAGRFPLPISPYLS